MGSRLAMMAMSVRNTVGRFLSRTPLRGIMSSYTAEQIEQARADFLYFDGKALAAHASASVAAYLASGVTGSHEGEDSFDDTVFGDHDQARGRSQWHNSRRQLILQNTGIDVWNATPDQQREAMYREITESWSWYKHVWAALLATSTVQEAVTVLVVQYEQSASQSRDITRRTALADYWLAYAQQNWMPTS